MAHKLQSAHDHPGHKYIAKLEQVVDERQDTWLVYEVGGSTLSSNLFLVKGDFYRGERIYSVVH
jgi:hypothetical protein